MDKTCLLILFLCVAGSSHAAGIDLSLNACPGNAGVANDRVLDCGGDDSVSVYAVVQPFEDIPDLVWLDVTLSLVSSGDFSVTPFWSFDPQLANNNGAALTASHAKPTSGCAGYLDTWNAGAFWVAHRFTTAFERILVTSYRYDPRPVYADQKLFGFKLTMDLRGSAEAGGDVPGCRFPVCLSVLDATLRTSSQTATTVLTSGSVFGNQVTLNGGTGEMCAAVPTRRATWGRIKAMYR